MTIDEIKKGLDCCSEFICGECPYNIYESKEYPLRCIHKLLSDMKELEEAADKIEIHFKPPYETKYAVIEFCCRKDKPLAVASYYIYGKEYKSGKPLICWHWQKSMLFNVVEDNISTENNAKERLKMLCLSRKQGGK